MENKVDKEAIDMTAQEWFEKGSMFTLDFLSPEEQETIYKIMDLYAHGKVRFHAASLLKERDELKERLKFWQEDTWYDEKYVNELLGAAGDAQEAKEKECEYLRNLLRQSGTFFRDELTDNARKLFDSIDESLQRKPNSDIQTNGASQQQPNSSNTAD